MIDSQRRFDAPPPAALPVELPAGPFRPPPAVLATRARESVVLLDRSTERYLFPDQLP